MRRIEVKNNNLLSKKAFWAKYSDNFKQEKFKNILNKQLEDVKQNLLLKRLPDAIIIGVKKAGTRATLEYLRLHDQIKAPGPEVHFFDRNYKYGLDWYREQMPPAAPEDVIIEKTPRYFISPEAPTKIRSMNQKMKLIVVFRDPVTRLLSEYAQIASKRPGLPSFEQMAFLDANRTRVNCSWGAVHTGLYEKHLRHWLKLFPKSQILFISGKTKGRLHPVVSEKDLQTLRQFYKPYNDVLYKLIGQSFDCLRGGRSTEHPQRNPRAQNGTTVATLRCLWLQYPSPGAVHFAKADSDSDQPVASRRVQAFVIPQICEKVQQKEIDPSYKSHEASVPEMKRRQEFTYAQMWWCVYEEFLLLFCLFKFVISVQCPHSGKSTPKRTSKNAMSTAL
ncbi:Heparan sulfate glucosamine 3-O-sulfotransferase 3B1 [Trichinella spiralis]|uniref:Heparan sulfate glucosamine 3-O-sulfotransferase 3B1 n=1 Tax=Trichinella spiralis TaxID=6334 RepID=A0ABR3KAV1_TRISP